jgi:hypothetical protein
MMANNPWIADNLQAFLFLNCPECAFKTKKQTFFQNHATKNHPLSCVFFTDTTESEFLDSDCIDKTLEEIMYPEVNIIVKKTAPKKAKSEKVNNRNNRVDNTSNLILHKSYQTQSKHGIYHVCEFCDYKTRSKIQFKSHIEIHANVLPIAVLSKKVQTKMVSLEATQLQGLRSLKNIEKNTNAIKETELQSESVEENMNTYQTLDSENFQEKLVKCPIENCNREVKPSRLKIHLESKLFLRIL